MGTQYLPMKRYFIIISITIHHPSVIDDGKHGLIIIILAVVVVVILVIVIQMAEQLKTFYH